MRALVLFALAGCYRPSAFEDPCAITCTEEVGCPDGLRCSNGRCGTSCGGTDDGDTDAPGTECEGSDLVELCFPASGIQPLILPLEIDTDDVCPIELPQASGKPLCVFAGESIRIDQRVRFHGGRSVVLFSATDLVIELAGSLDLSQGGAGSQPSEACTEEPGPAGQADGTPGGGGAGGSFVAAGGAGGPSGTTRQVAAPEVAVGYVRGGCNGHAGGSNASESGNGAGGYGGGAIWLYARGTIDIAGRVHANGSGGHGAGAGGAGGGGGGAGGLVGLEAASVVIRAGAAVVANGGGGGGGAQTNAGGAGSGGRFDAQPAAGGPGGGTGIGGGPGWPGISGSLDGNGTGAINGGGGGGGGGGAGTIRVVTNMLSNEGVLAPPPKLVTPPARTAP